MGCCGSKEAIQEPNEATHLLSANQTNAEVPQGQPTMDAQSYAAEALERETAKLNQVVQKTAENLIDISRIHSVERVKLQDSAFRAEEYQQLLNGSQRFAENSDESRRLSHLFSLPSSEGPSTPIDPDLTRVEQMLSMATSPNTKSNLQDMSATTKKLASQIESIHVECNNDFVVPLTFGSQTPTITNH